MEKVIIVLLGLAAMAAADCGPMDRLKVKSEWAHVYGNSGHRVEFGVQIFNSLFKKDAAARDLFKRVKGDNVHSSDFKAHVARVMGGFDTCVSLLEADDILTAHLAHLKTQHADRGIDAKYFSEMGEVFMEVIPQWLDHSFDRDAWKDCYAVIAGGIA